MNSDVVAARKPHNQLLYMWVADALSDSERYKDCLDLACGDMRLYTRVRSGTYTGVDADRDRIARAAKRHPDATTIHGLIERIGDVSGDLVVCIQTIGINDDFNNANTLQAVRNCITATRPGGTLILNIGYRAAEYHEQAVGLLADAFAVVDRRVYGAFRRGLSYWRSWLVASVMKAFPSLAVSRSKPNILFVCEGRKLAPAVSYDQTRLRPLHEPAGGRPA